MGSLKFWMHAVPGLQICMSVPWFGCDYRQKWRLYHSHKSLWSESWKPPTRMSKDFLLSFWSFGSCLVSYKHSKHASSQLGRRLETLWAHTSCREKILLQQIWTEIEGGIFSWHSTDCFYPPTCSSQLVLVLLLGVAKPSGLEETLNKVEVGVWSHFACLVAFLEIAEFCSKSAKTQRGYPLCFGHWPITKIINYLFI